MHVRLVLVTVLLLVVPNPASAQPDSFHTPDGFDLQGHRGARGLAPENTLPAFRRGLDLGVTTLEMDVVISGDGQVVVSHEPWMSPVLCSLPSGAPVSEAEEQSHNLYRMSYEEIERYDCGQRRHPDFPEQEAQPAVKPLLRDVVTIAENYVDKHDRPPVFYNVEIKSRPAWDGRFHPAPEVFARRVLDVVHEENVAARTAIQSFDLRVLRVTKRLRSKRDDKAAVRIALLMGRSATGGLSEQLDRLGFTPAVYSPAYQLVDETLLREAHDRGLRVIPWTVNQPDDMRRLIRLGVDGLITDVPNRAREVLAAVDLPSD